MFAKDNRAMAAEVNSNSRAVFKLPHELRKHSSALHCQRAKRSRRFGIGGRQHTGRSGGSFPAWLGAFQQQDLCSLFAQFQCKGNANDPRTGDDDIVGSHTGYFIAKP